MRRLCAVAVVFCLIAFFSGCADGGVGEEVFSVSPTFAPTVAPSAEPTVSPEPTPNTNEIYVKQCDTARWITSSGDYVEADLTYVSLDVNSEENFFRDDYLLLTLRCDGRWKEYRLGANGSLPDYYLHPCNVTGGNSDLLITKGTTLIGIEIWTYELFIVEDDLTLTLVSDYERVPQPSIRVKKTTIEERVIVEVEGDNGMETIVDLPLPLNPMDWFEGGVDYLVEDESTADLLHSNEVTPEDINGDGIDELCVFFDLGGYKCWYGGVNAWMAYDDGEWKTAKLEFIRYD